MKLQFDLDKEKTLTLHQIIKIILICLTAGAVSSLINFTLGACIIGFSLLFLLWPTIMKFKEKKK